MNHSILLCSVSVILVLSSLSCKSDEATAPTSTVSVAQYAGVWTGTTGQNLPVYFRITSQGVIDSLTVRIRLNVGPYSCNATLTKDSGATVQNGAFVGRVKLPGSTVFTSVRATLGSPSIAQGTYDSYWASSAVACGAIFFYGSSDSVIKLGTWQATRTSQ